MESFDPCLHHSVAGLVPSSVHRVTVSAKSLTGDQQGKHRSAFVEVRTKAGGTYHQNLFSGQLFVL